MTALFLKYRPQIFSDVVGQSPVVKTLQNAIKSETPSHAYLFCGSRGTGKTSMARIFAKALNCQNQKDGNPCNECGICNATREGHCVDVIEIDAASNRGINEIREIRDKIAFAPSVAKRKVYIIDEVHMLTKEAFNALLKTLEEPPSHAYFALATTELHKVPETIQSRCQTFLFQTFTIAQLVERLSMIADKEGFKYEKEALEMIGKKAEGGLRDALSLLEQIAAESEKNITVQTVTDSLGLVSIDTLEKFYQALETKQPQVALEIIQNLSRQGSDFRSFGHDLLVYLREKMHANIQNQQPVGIIIQTINTIQTALTRLKTTPIVELPFEIAILEITQHTQAEPVVMTAPKAPAPPTDVARNVSTTQPPAQPSAPSIQHTAPSSSIDDFSFDKPTPSPHPQASSTSDPKPSTPPPAPVSHEPIPVNVSVMKERMKSITELTTIPGLIKKSFLSCEPTIENGTIVFLVGSEFHYEKLKNATIQTQLKQTIHEMFTGSFPIEFRMNKNVATANDVVDFFSN